MNPEYEKKRKLFHLFVLSKQFPKMEQDFDNVKGKFLTTCWMINDYPIFIYFNYGEYVINKYPYQSIRDIKYYINFEEFKKDVRRFALGSRYPEWKD